jgi:copper homeostasis protein
MKRLLEVIACSVEDAVEAEAGGAGRIELVRDLHLGGMTPPVSLVKDVLAKVTIPVRVMVRETVSHEVERQSDRDLLHEAAHGFSQLAIDGIVLGFLRNGSVDLELMDSVLEAAANPKATFHRAFEETNNPYEAIAALKRLGRVDRILTKVTPALYVAAAAPEILMLAGGGLTLNTPDLREFHVGSAARDTSGVVRRELVQSLVIDVENCA